MHQRLKKDADILIAALLAMLVHTALFLCQSNFITDHNFSPERHNRIGLRIVHPRTTQKKSTLSTPIAKKTKVSADKTKSSYPKKMKNLLVEKKRDPEEKQKISEKNERIPFEENAISENTLSLEKHSQKLAHTHNSAKENGSSVVEAIVQKLQKPFYPHYSRTHGEEGKVIIQVKISEEGELKSYHVIKSSGHSRLDKAAIKAIKKSTFAPARQFNKTVSSEKSIAFVFRLEDK